MPLHVLVATADAASRERLLRLAAAQSWRAEIARDAREILGKISPSGRGLILADWGAAEPGGLVKRIRERAPRYAVVLLAASAELAAGAAARGLACGADDVVSREASEGSLLTRLAACERSLRASAGKEDVLCAGDLKADLSRRRVFARGRGAGWKAVDGLSPQEFSLLCLFLTHPGLPLERGRLLAGSWRRPGREANLETVDKHVEGLRRKLGRQGRAIRTVSGRGYVYDPTPRRSTT